jgi:hypothetical protein
MSLEDYSDRVDDDGTMVLLCQYRTKVFSPFPLVSILYTF